MKIKMKLQLLVLGSMFVLGFINLNAQYVAFDYRGAWSEWFAVNTKYINGYSSLYTTNLGINGEVIKYTDNSGLTLRAENGFDYFVFRISGYAEPSSDEKKYHYETNTGYEYQGTVEYYVTENYPTAEAFAKVNRFIIPDPRNDGSAFAKRSTTCTVRINPYKYSPEIYNVYFDGIGVAVDVRQLRFNDRKSKQVRRKRNRGKKALNIILTVLLGPLGAISWAVNPID